MGRRERQELKTELKKLSQIDEEGPEFLDQNQRVADAEKRVSWAENLLVRVVQVR